MQETLVNMNTAIKKYRLSGFTFIELMFIIVFISMTMLYAASLNKNQARIDAINKAAVGMKMWEQAALAYHADHNKWPEVFSDDLVGKYLPTELVCSPFAGPGGEGCQLSLAPYRGQPDCFKNDNYRCYSINLKTPDEAVAKQIAKKLPASNANSDGTVFSSVSVPGAKQGYVTSAGIIKVDNDRSITLPDCSAGFDPHYLTTPAYYSTGFEKGEKKDKIKLATLLGMGQLFKKDDRWLVFASANFLYNSIFGKDAFKGKYYAYFMTFCVPVGEWKGTNFATGLNEGHSTDDQKYDW